jgi:hypothetical protein
MLKNDLRDENRFQIEISYNRCNPALAKLCIESGAKSRSTILDKIVRVLFLKLPAYKR